MRSLPQLQLEPVLEIVKPELPIPGKSWGRENSELPDYFQELRYCCKDEVAFGRVQEILGLLQANQELALRQSNEKFSKAFRSSPSAITITALNTGRCLEVNDSFVRISGYSRAEVIGRTTDELGLWLNPQDREQVLQVLQLEGSIRNLEFEFRLKSGENSTGLFSAEIIEFDGEPCIIATTEDITEYKRTEAELKSALERDRLLGEVALRIRQSLDLSQVLETTVAEVRCLLKADRVFIGYRDGIDTGKVVAESVDPRFPSILPWKCDEAKVREAEAMFAHVPALIADNVWESDECKADHEFLLQYAVQASLLVPIWLGSEFFGVIVVHQCSATRHWQTFEVNFLEQLANQVAIAIQQGQLYHQVCTLNCNLERQVQERTLQLQQRLQELQELNELKDFFLHAISHDLRTPIMGMLLVLQNLLKQESQQVLIARKTIERMLQSSDRQLGMLNTLLDSHALEVGASQLAFAPLDLLQLIQDTLLDLEPLLEKNQTLLSQALPLVLPPVMADRDQIQRVLENLITNALKHNPPGLSLKVGVEIGVDQKEGSQSVLKCYIQDDGVGIENSDRLFERYGKSMKYTAGIGLGLYLCRQIVTAHGGEIFVDSQPGEGATFCFSLPLPC